MEDIYTHFPLLERSIFYKAYQEPTESVEDYLLRLKVLARLCEFAEFYNEVLRDRFVLGLRDKETRNTLLYTRNLANLTMEQAKDIAIASAAAAVIAERNSSSNGGPSNLALTSPNTALISNRTSMPGLSQDVCVGENLTNGKTQDYLSTSNPEPLIYPALANIDQPNQVNPNINDANSSAQLPISHHTSMPGTSQVADILFQNSPTGNNTQAYLTTTSNLQPSSFLPPDAPSPSYNEHMHGPNEEQSHPIDTSLISPVKRFDGKTIYPCPFCEKTYPNKSWLKAHIPKHSSEKKFPCRFCQKRLTYPGSLKNHEYMCKKNPKTQINIKKENTQE